MYVNVATSAFAESDSRSFSEARTDRLVDAARCAA
jgi:hypothetical protein